MKIISTFLWTLSQNFILTGNYFNGFLIRVFFWDWGDFCDFRQCFPASHKSIDWRINISKEFILFYILCFFSFVHYFESWGWIFYCLFVICNCPFYCSEVVRLILCVISGYSSSLGLCIINWSFCHKITNKIHLFDSLRTNLKSSVVL